MKTLWYSGAQPTSRTTKGAGPKAQKLKLTKKACTELYTRCKASHKNYVQALKDATKKINDIMSEVAKTNHKGIRQVAQDLHFEGHLSQKHHQKPNTWNAFLWSKSQEKKNNGMASNLSLSWEPWAWY